MGTLADTSSNFVKAKAVLVFCNFESTDLALSHMSAKLVVERVTSAVPMN